MANRSFYEVLGVSENASDNEIKKQYSKLEKEYHPDKNPEGGDRFEEISCAYEVLSDPKKKSEYDKLTAVQDGIPGDVTHLSEGESSDSSDGDFDGNMRRNQKVYKLEVSLDELYNGGKTAEFQLRKNVLCATCKGKGSKSRQTEKCHTCKSCGQKVSLQPIASAKMIQMKSRCPDCKGDGEMIRKNDLCPSCGGNKVCNETKILEVHLDKGMRDGEQFLFRGEGDQEPDVEPGDVVIRLRTKVHDKFERENNDLYYRHTITLTEALCGFSFGLKHLDGRDLLIKHPPGKVIKPGDMKTVPREGMPIYKNPSKKGNLYIHFIIKFPENNFTNEANLKMFDTLLALKPSFVKPVGEHVEEIELRDYARNESFGIFCGEATNIHRNKDPQYL